ncbi:nuclear transport factor 2 family protein [Mangrovicoccus algicola]|uniref:Nuclear transport factor 2 family protein n=1 Tax=Mangrovicoccus algicola TaxID=2771008 RepID=A0A8J7CZU3_9RHOB|nr:nuclear transport factor 2 family protein [Mangrovicoccus algicola]MBE3638458.1 nuclear transport factor 2 family protein [Mangrovicoccus algicola]
MAEISHIPGAIAPGFAHRWDSVPEYVLGLSWELCEGRGLSAILEHHDAAAISRSPARVLSGARAILAEAMSELAEFPDREMLGEDVIWHDTPPGKDVAAGFHASLRAHGRATHLGEGRHGAATGRPGTARVMTDMWCSQNRIRDIWTVADSAALAHQLCGGSRAMAERLIVAEGGPERCVVPLTPDTDLEGPYFGRGNRSEPGAELEDLLRELMSGGFSVIPDRYDRACELAYPGGLSEQGHRAADRFWLGLRSAFPAAAFRVDHVSGMEEEGQMPRAALRWSLYGKHDGPGLFGPATGCFAYVMGITHAEFGPRGLRREWTLIDEVAIWKQLLLAAA